jgi:ubiquinone/menaquinone biosynthesis C-methylase UbiE
MDSVVARELDPGEENYQDVGQFNVWARRYERSKWQRLVFDRVHGRALGLTSGWRDPDAVLDVGCGSGRLLRAAHRRWPNARLIGIDPSAGMIEAGRQLTPGELHLAGAEAIPLPDASVDLAFSTIAFHHWTDAGQGLREVARVLKPDGHFVLIDNIGPDWMARYLKDRPYLEPHERITVWSENGLRVTRQKTMFLFPLLPILLATVSMPQAGAR